MHPSLLGVMELDANSYEWKDLGHLAITWLQDAGGFAAVGLAVWFIYVLGNPSAAIVGGRRKMISRFMAITAGLALIAYLVAGGFTISAVLADDAFAEQMGFAGKPANPNQPTPMRPLSWVDKAQGTTLAIAGALALLAFGEPFFLDLFRLRWRRVYALAKLSFKEAVRRRVVWVFFIFLLVFLFPATWFFFKRVKPEDVLKTTISVIAYAMTALLTITALLLSGFSIPTDVKNQTIHTIVTKPVERFEIVVGRFLGFVALETIALFALTAVSLLFIETSNVDEAARKESMKARVPVYGRLALVRERQDNQQAFEGIDVGREYNYRKYIAGGKLSTHRAVWTFNRKGDLRDLADLPAVPMEFAFDVYRTTKGPENRGVECSFDITTRNWNPAREAEYQDAIRKTFDTYPKNINFDDERIPDSWKKMDEIAEKFGRWEFKSFLVNDYHTYTLKTPTGLIKNVLRDEPATNKKSTPAPPAMLSVKVKCESDSQLVGVAPLDLYLLESEGVFEWNFFKGALGLWCRLTIVIGLAVAASTYLAGVISALGAFFLFLAGYFQEFIQTLAAGTNIGGGPFESFTRLLKGVNTASELDKTPGIQASLFGDRIYRWGLRRFMNVIPDPDRFTWSNYLAQGFNINFEFILLNLLFLAAYMLPWAILAYYLMRSREIAA